jgi:hypothetical protein
MTTMTAQALAQIFMLGISVAIGIWYFVPWSLMRPRGDALIPLLWIHTFRFLALQVVAVQQAGYPISDLRRDELIYGDMLGALLALAAIVALRYRGRLAIPLVWLFVGETAVDFVRNISGGISEHLFGVATGTVWLTQALYIPVLFVSLGLIVWQLYARRGEPLAQPADRDAAAPAARPVMQPSH